MWPERRQLLCHCTIEAGVSESTQQCGGEDGAGEVAALCVTRKRQNVESDLMKLVSASARSSVGGRTELEKWLPCVWLCVENDAKLSALVGIEAVSWGGHCTPLKLVSASARSSAGGRTEPEKWLPCVWKCCSVRKSVQCAVEVLLKISVSVGVHASSS